MGIGKHVLLHRNTEDHPDPPTGAFCSKIQEIGTLDASGRFLPAQLTDQMQSNKRPNKSLKHAKILFQIKQIQNSGFEITFDIFDT
jgi:hypothetical protein